MNKFVSSDGFIAFFASYVKQHSLTLAALRSNYDVEEIIANPVLFQEIQRKYFIEAYDFIVSSFVDVLANQNVIQKMKRYLIGLDCSSNDQSTKTSINISKSDQF